MDFFNFYGLAITVIIMIPNIICALLHKEMFENKYRGKFVLICEQTGRYGCIIFMILNIPYVCFGFWFNKALTVYLAVNGVLCAVYLIFWIICRNRNGKLKALSLSIIPSAIFLFCSVVTANIPLAFFAVLFAANHILLSYKNAVYNTEK